MFINGKWVDPIDLATIEYVHRSPLKSRILPYDESTVLLTQVCLLSIFTNPSLTAISSQATKKLNTTVPIGSAKDVDVAVEAARVVSCLTFPSLLLDSLDTRTQQAYKNSWGLKCPGAARGKLLAKLADLVEKYADELAALEALNVGPCRLFHSPYNIFTSCSPQGNHSVPHGPET